MVNHMFNKICSGIGLVALDVVINQESEYDAKIYCGGSCGNVLTILSFLGFDSYPIARLDDNNATSLIISDLEKWGVNTSFLKSGLNGSTPIIIHRILSDSKNNPRHRFEFKNPVSGKWLPGYEPVLSRDVESIYKKLPTSHVFYLDRISRA